jgi:branched-chain amino acid aminotransferase/4-amino-4-deoxychorismate lyase
MGAPADEFSPWLGVFETLRVIDGKPLFFVEHRDEMQRAMDALGLATDTDFAAEAAKLPPKSGRWRWIVTKEATETPFTEEPPPSREPVALTVSPVRVGSCNWDARFKTLSYLAHAQAWRMAEGGEAVLLNEAGHVASVSRGNIFWRRGDTLFTPAHEAGCRCGVVRGFVLLREQAETGHFPLGDLREADEVFLTNSLRGIASVHCVEDRLMPSTSTADRLRKAYDEMVMRTLEDRLS